MEKPLEKSDIPALTGKQAAAYALAGIDINNAGSLVLEAIAQAIRTFEQQPQTRVASNSQTAILPPLRPAQLHALEALESKLIVSIKRVLLQAPNEAKIYEFLCSYVVEIFDFYIAAYNEFDELTPEWTESIKNRSVHRVVSCYKGVVAADHYSGSYQRGLPAVLETYSRH
jgi:hypothetical protein